MSTNNQTTDKDTNVPYKLPTDIESRFDADFCFDDMDTPDLRVVKSLRTNRNQTAGVKNFIATELVKQLEWMLGELKDEPREIIKKAHPSAKNGYYLKTKDTGVYARNKLRAELRAKVLSKLQEYKS